MIAGAIFLSAVDCAAADLSGPNRSALERAINRTLENGQENVATSWNGYEGVGGTVAAHRTSVSRTGHQCATVTYRIVTPKPAPPVQEKRCRKLELGGIPVWNVVLTAATPPPSTPRQNSEPHIDKSRRLSLPEPNGRERAETARIQSALAELLYYRGRIDGHFNDTTRTAFHQFLQDEGKHELPQSPAEALQWLDNARKRIRNGHCPPTGVGRAAVVACGVLVD